ncbi:MAG: (Fe-S)-binding protein [Anaerolineae bacterium]
MTKLDTSLLSARQLLSLDACSRCGECIPACPVLAATGEGQSTAFNKISLWRQALRRGVNLSPGPLRSTQGRLSPKRGGKASLSRLWKGKVGLGSSLAAELVAAAYDCTLCGRCQAVCPVYIRTHDLWIGQRRQLLRAQVGPEAIAQLAERLHLSGNIAGRPAEERLSWLNNMAEPPPFVATSDVLVFVGCLGSLYPQAFALPQALLSLLSLAGVRVALLRERELCCGFPLYTSGLEEEALSLAQRNLAAFKAAGARTVVTPCPSCYHTLSKCYPRWLGGAMDVRVLPGVEYLEELGARIQPLLKPLPLRLTYHDPCDLGRLSGIYEIPRRLLRLIPGLELVEMAENREQALCCGGGGDVEMVNPHLAEAIADKRLAQAMDTGAEAIATACPQCKRALSAAARRARQPLRTYDVAELLLRSTQGT